MGLQISKISKILYSRDEYVQPYSKYQRVFFV